MSYHDLMATIIWTYRFMCALAALHYGLSASAAYGICAGVAVTALLFLGCVAAQVAITRTLVDSATVTTNSSEYQARLVRFRNDDKTRRRARRSVSSVS